MCSLITTQSVSVIPYFQQNEKPFFVVHTFFNNQLIRVSKAHNLNYTCQIAQQLNTSLQTLRTNFLRYCTSCVTLIFVFAYICKYSCISFVVSTKYHKQTYEKHRHPAMDFDIMYADIGEFPLL